MLEDTHFRIGARNLFDTQPSITVPTAISARLYAAPYGRYIYVSIGKRFWSATDPPGSWPRFVAAASRGPGPGRKQGGAWRSM